MKEAALAFPPERSADPAHAGSAALRSRGRRELTLLVVLLACGLFLVPLLIWVIGRGVLGPYPNGSPFALLVDFFAGLGTGSPLYWGVALGPYVFAILLRTFWHLLSLADRAQD